MANRVELRGWSGSDFPLHCDYQVQSATRVHPIHTHDGVEIVYVTRGSGTNIIGGLPYPIITGDLYVIDVGATHAFTAEAGLEFFNIIFQNRLFSPGEMAELRELPAFTQFVLPAQRTIPAKCTIPPSHSELVTGLCSRLTRELAARRAGHQLLAKAVFIDLLITVCRLYREEQDPTARAEGRIARALGHIHEHYHETLSVDALASLVGLSPGHFGEVFKAQTGTSVHGYLNRVRVDHARELLMSTRESITRIALACGYEDLGYFARIFKRLNGQTPRAFRAQIWASGMGAGVGTIPDLSPG